VSLLRLLLLLLLLVLRQLLLPTLRTTTTSHSDILLNCLVFFVHSSPVSHPSDAVDAGDQHRDEAEVQLLCALITEKVVARCRGIVRQPLRPPAA
jgi:hypothetical protein